MAGLPPFFNAQFFDSEGLPAAGYLLYTYLTGTTTPKVSYADQAEVAANTNPITLDADGRCSLWLADDAEYAIALHTPADALVKRWDDVAAVPVLDVGAYVPLAGGVTMTGRFNLAGAAQASLQPVTLQQLTDAVSTGTSSVATDAELAAAVAALEVLIDAEEAARIAADTALGTGGGGSLAAETAARTAADTALEVLIDAEEAARIAADAVLTAAIAAINAGASAVPVGTVVMWFHGAIPSGYLALEGGVGNRTTHAVLYGLWGTTYGVGDGSLTFGLPDFRGYFPRGWDNTAGVDAGRVLGSTQDDLFEAHVHTGLEGDTSDDDNGDYGNYWIVNDGGGGHSTIANSTTASTGGAETRPKNLAVRFIVKAL